MFLVGKPTEHASQVLKAPLKTIEERLKHEGETHGDIMRNDVPEKYGHNVVVKLYAAYTWFVKNCPSAKYMFRIDDDIVVDIPRFMLWKMHKFDPITEKVHGHKAIWGKGKSNPPIRDKNNKWFVPFSEYAANDYPPYLLGIFNLYTRQAVTSILKLAPKQNMLRIEDILYTGLIGKKAGVKLFPSAMHVCFAGQPEKVNRHKCERINGKKVPMLLAENVSGISDSEYVRLFHRLKMLKCRK